MCIRDSHVPTQDDGDFTWEKFEAAYNGELGNDLGNLVQRVAKMVQSYQAGVIGDAPQSEHDMGPYRQAMESYMAVSYTHLATNKAWSDF